MRHKICYSVQAQLVDHDKTVISSPPMFEKLAGLACHDDSALHYAELPFAEEAALRGGYPRVVIDGQGRLLMTVEVDALRKLTRQELKLLREDFAGQMTDGIGAGCFDGLSSAAGVALQVRFPLQATCKQETGTAWKPKASTSPGNKRRIAAVAKLVEARDVSAGTPRGAGATGSATKASGRAEKEKPNFKKLFRLLAKPERDLLFEQIKAELEACGNDLSMVEDGEFPYGNFGTPKLLRLLLKAGLPPDLRDNQGHPLLHHAVVTSECVQLMLKAGVDVNCTVSDFEATALMRAARLGKRKSVELLLAAGADPSITNPAGKTALDLVNTPHCREREPIETLLNTAAKP